MKLYTRILYNPGKALTNNSKQRLTTALSISTRKSFSLIDFLLLYRIFILAFFYPLSQLFEMDLCCNYVFTGSFGFIRTVFLNIRGFASDNFKGFSPGCLISPCVKKKNKKSPCVKEKVLQHPPSNFPVLFLTIRSPSILG